jgi:hypothetical protein
VGRTGTVTLLLISAAGAASCGGRSNRTDGPNADPPAVASFPPVGCAEELDERPAVDHARITTLATGADLRVEAVGQQDLVAYTVSEGGSELRSLFVVRATTDESPALVATGLPRISETSELVIRFEQSTLLVMTGVENDVAEELFVWRVGDAGLTAIARTVDPTAIRASRDGRFLSVEADDRRQDMTQTVNLLLIDLSDLSSTHVGALDQPRARFTRDSSALVFSGVTRNPSCANVRRWSLEDRNVTEVTCASPLARWEITPDGAWLLHGLDPVDPSFECPLLLAQSRLDGEVTLANPGECLLSGPDKELDLSDGGARLAFLARPSDPNLGGAALQARPFDGGDTLELSPSDVIGIVDHFEQTIAFRVAVDDCGDHLMSVPNSGGDVWDLGMLVSWCPTPGAVEPVLDEEDGALLALSPDRTLRFQPGPGQGPVLLGCGVTGAALSTRTRVLFSAPHQGGTGLFRYDQTTGEVRVLEPGVTGPFALTPGNGAWLAVTVPDPAGGALVQDFR